MRPTGAVSAAAIATEIMILFNIESAIAQLTSRVEKSMYRLHSSTLQRALSSAPKVRRCPAFSAETANATPAGFRLHFYEDFARNRLKFISTKRDQL